MIDFTIDTASCIRCGECVTECPARIISMQEGIPAIAAEMRALCYRCQHCLAICPTGAFSILGLEPAGSRSLSESLPAPDQMENMIMQRRSVRRYKPENLAPELLQRLLDVAWNAPTGKNTRDVLFTVVDDREKLSRLRADVMAGLGRVVREGGLPKGREYFTEYVRLWEQHQVDCLFRGAPHLLVASAPAQSVSPLPDCLIALSYFEMFALSLGVGTVWNGLTKWVISDMLPETLHTLGIPEDHLIGYVMSFGMPALSFARTTQRGPAAVNRVHI